MNCTQWKVTEITDIINMNNKATKITVTDQDKDSVIAQPNKWADHSEETMIFTVP
jgi:hypothetical protein